MRPCFRTAIVKHVCVGQVSNVPGDKESMAHSRGSEWSSKLGTSLGGFLNLGNARRVAGRGRGREHSTGDAGHTAADGARRSEAQGRGLGQPPLSDSLVAAHAAEEMDIRDREFELFSENESADEIANTFDPVSGTPAAPCDGGDGAADEPDEGGMPDPATAAAVAAGVSEFLDGLDIGAGDATGGADDPSAGGDGVPDPPPREPWEELGEPTSLGYIYDSTPRALLRIQRGKPPRNVTINCYRHSGCKMLLSEDRAPDDCTLKRWLFEVPAAAPGSSTMEARSLTEQHMALGYGRWGGKRRRAK